MALTRGQRHDFGLPSARPRAGRVRAVLAATLAIALSLFAWQLLTSSHAGAASYTVVTDQTVYGPGDIVTITGAGYQPATSYDVVVVRPDGSIVNGSGTGAPGFDTVVSDSAGNIIDSYKLTIPAPTGVYTVNVYATSDTTHSYVLALTTFYDDTPYPTSITQATAGLTVTVSGTWKWDGCVSHSNANKHIGFAIVWGDGTGIANPSPPPYQSRDGVYPTNGPVAGTWQQCQPPGTGTWGPISHTYASGANVQVCVITYDVAFHAPNPPATSGEHSTDPWGNEDNSYDEYDSTPSKQQQCAPVNTATPTPTATSTGTATAIPTSTATPTRTSTSTPTATNTPVPPTATSTAVPTATNTPVPPTATFTAVPTATNTPVPPTATFTAVPTATNTPVPPTATFTAVPTATFTAVPTATFTAVPTATLTPSASPTVTPTPGPGVVQWLKSPAAGQIFLTDGTQTFQFDEVLYNQTDPNGLGGFSFDINFDPTIWQQPSVDLSPAVVLFASTGRLLSCNISLLTANVDHIVCASTGTLGTGPVFTGPKVMAHVTLRPRDIVVGQIRPNKENGIVTAVKDTNVTVANTCGQPLNDGTIQPLPGQPECQGLLLTGVLPGGLLPQSMTVVTIRRLEGDVTKDCSVDVADMQLEASKYGTAGGSLVYNVFYDVNSPLSNGDGQIDILDVQFVYGRFGSTCLSPIPPQAPQALP